MLDKIDIIIKTFNRYDCLERLLASIRRFYPLIDIIIADDSTEYNLKFYKKWKRRFKNLKVLFLEPDSGISYGRNMAVEASEKPFVLLLDDDVVFTKFLNIEKLYKVINSNDNIKVAGGLVIENGREVHYEFFMNINNGILTEKPLSKIPEVFRGIKYFYTDSVLNFALFKRDLFNEIKWDNNLKLAEHLDFYVRFSKLGYKAVYVPEVKDIHTKKNKPEYIKFRRNRNDEYHIKSFKKMGIKKIITIRGYDFELKNKEFLRIKQI